MEPGAWAFLCMKIYACRSIAFPLLGMLKRTCTIGINLKNTLFPFYMCIAFFWHCFFYSILSIFVVNFDENCWLSSETFPLICKIESLKLRWSSGTTGIKIKRKHVAILYLLKLNLILKPVYITAFGTNTPCINLANNVIVPCYKDTISIIYIRSESVVVFLLYLCWQLPYKCLFSFTHDLCWTPAACRGLQTFHSYNSRFFLQKQRWDSSSPSSKSIKELFPRWLLLFLHCQEASYPPQTCTDCTKATSHNCKCFGMVVLQWLALHVGLI